MKRHLYFLPLFICLIFTQNTLALDSFPKVVTENGKDYFPLVANSNAAAILVDKADYGVVHIAAIQEEYYRLQAAGKDSHVYFLEYSEEDIRERLARWEAVAIRAEKLKSSIPEELQAAYFELVEYPVRGAWMLNGYQLLSRLSMAHATYDDAQTALADAARATEMYQSLNR